MVARQSAVRGMEAHGQGPFSARPGGAHIAALNLREGAPGEIGLDEAPAAFRALAANEPGHVKALIHSNGTPRDA